jgi:RNA polymerase sigma factor (sigma-70 family)
MSRQQLRREVECIRYLAGAPARKEFTDDELLNQFLQHGDETAFAGLVQRHGPLVWGLCRRVLGQEQDAEDAFQATFVILARKAGAIRRQRSLASWLYEVAFRVALKARAKARQRQTREREAVAMAQSGSVPESAWRELQGIIDEEVNRLPAKYRRPLVLCCLQGKTQAQAARALGCPAGSMSRCLTQGRELLRRRLERRGLTVPAAFAGTLFLGQGAQAALRATLLRDTLQSVRAFLQTGAAGLSASVGTLVEGGLKTLAITKLKVLLVLVLAGTISAAGIGPDGSPTDSAPAGVEQREERQAAPAETQAMAPHSDLQGDALPSRAIARLGSVRFRQGLTFRAVFSPDGKKIATTGAGLRLWDAATGKPLVHVAGRLQTTALAFSPDGKLVATQATVPHGEIALCKAALLDANTGKMVQDLSDAQPVAFAFSADGKALAMAGFQAGIDDGLLMIWDTATRKLLHRVALPGMDVRSLVFSPDGKILVGTSNRWGAPPDTRLHVWDAVTAKELTPFTGHEQPLNAVAFSPNGKLLASGGEDKTVRLWEPSSRKQIRVLTPRVAGVSAIAFSPDGATFASGHRDGTIILWQSATGHELRRWRAHGITFGLFRDSAVTSLSFSPNSPTLASAAVLDGGPRLWDTATGKEILASPGHRGYIDRLAFVPDGGKILTVGRDRAVMEWDLSTTRPRQVLQLETDGPYASLSADRKIMARITEDDGALELWDLAEGKKLRTLAKYGMGETGADVCLSPDGRLLACSAKYEIHVWDLANRKELRSFRGDGVVFSPDSTILAWREANSLTIHFQEALGGKELREIDFSHSVDSHSVRYLEFSPDGRYFAAGSSAEGAVQVWDLVTGKSLSLTGIRRRASLALAFSPDGRYIGVGEAGIGSSESARIFELLTGKEVCRFDGHDSCVLDFSPDGRSIAAATGDSSILIWDLTGRLDKGRLRPASLSPKEIEVAWNDLAGDNAAKAYQALWTLAAAPKQTIAWLKRRLHPVAAAPAERVAALISDLDSPRFPVREKARAELLKLGETALTVIQKTLKKNPPLETRQRLKQIVDRLTTLGPGQLQPLRAVTVLEQIGTPEARQVLQSLATGVADARLTQEARASLARLSGRPAALSVREHAP